VPSNLGPAETLRPPGGDPAPPGDTSDLYGRLDRAELGKRHWLTVFTAGMGFFTDAYDLFIIGTVTVLLTPIFHLDTNQISLLDSASLLASVLGALLFGRLMDRLGRKRMYGAEVAVLVVGALASACAWNFSSLLVFRLLVGFGVGGDYATSAVITSEYANQKARGRLIGTVFAMQGFGLIAGPAVASILLGAGVGTGVAWRLMLGLGAIPAASVVYLRRRIKETPRYAMSVLGDHEATAAAVAWVTAGRDDAAGAEPPADADAELDGARALATRVRPQGPDPGPGARAKLTSPPFRRRLIGTAGAWFLLDVAFYGNSVSSSLILGLLQPHGSLLGHTLLSLAVFGLAAFPGYWVAVWLLDRLGRRRIQWQGFAVMALAFSLIWLLPGGASSVGLFLPLFALSYFFVEFGPNMTTFVFPAEVFPTSIRGTGDGLSAGAGKLGGFLGALLVPHLLAAIGISGLMGVMAGVCVLGVVVTVLTLPEPRGQTLEAASGEHRAG